MTPADPELPSAVAPQTPLFGADSRTGVVGCEPGNGEAIIFRRVDDAVTSETVSWKPWLVTTEGAPLEQAEQVRLQGGGQCWLYQFPDMHAYHDGRLKLREAHAEMVALASEERQFLVQTGITFFKGMVFDDVRRMQIDIETTSLSPHVPGARILLAAVSDNRGFQEAVAGDECGILKRLNEIFAQRDPDVVEGHNIFSFDLPYLMARAEDWKQPLTWGRDGSAPRLDSRRNMPFGGLTRPFTPVHIFGRSIIDTLFGVQRYDVGRGEFASHGLKEVARYLGVAAEERVYVDRSAIDKLWESDPDTVTRYAMQDVEETGEVARIVMPADFYVSQMAPDSYQGCATSGTGEKINLLLIREYLRQGHAIPLPKAGRPVVGGYTELRRAGLVERVVKCDVESLYPSLMLARRIAPESDTLGVFLPFLKELTERRLQAKARKAATSGSERAYWDGLQASFKILINSFFGYMGAGFVFNDPSAAEQVTLGGQEIVQQVIRELEETGSQVIEVDTDGVYFQPPAQVQTLEQEEEYVARISTRLPEGIHLAHDGRWRAMVSLKVKNYALIGYDGRRVLRGAALRSRSDERFGQEFVASALDLVVEGRVDEIGALYLSTLRQIDRGEVPVEQITRRERVTSKSLEGRSLQRASGALANAQLGDYIRLYRRGDGSDTLIEDYAGDEDRDYLKGKLHKFAMRLKDAIGPEFDRLCPRPGGRVSKELAGQQSLDLF